MNFSKQNKTAILVFANSSGAELNRKPIAKGKLLFNKLNEYTLHTVVQSKLPYFCFTENEQKGTSFGERFINAIQSVFEKGFYNVIVIGNDTPQLKVSDILVAKEKIEQGKLVLGPSIDGGFYLLGINNQMFSLIKMKGLSWETSKLFSEVKQESCANNFEVATLKAYCDIDNISDIKELINSYGLSSTMLQMLLAIVASKKEIETNFTEFYKSTISKTYRNKGSPSIFLSQAI